MSRFVSKDTTRVELGDGDWAVIRKEVGYGARGAVQAKLMSNMTAEQFAAVQRATERAKKLEQGIDEGPKAPLPGDGEKIALNLRDSNIALLLEVVVEWGGPGFCDEHGQVAPITADNIAVLDESAERILEAFAKVSKSKTEGFTNPPSRPTSTEAAPTALPASALTT